LKQKKEEKGLVIEKIDEKNGWIDGDII